MNKKTIRDIEVKNKTVLVRADFNVPLKDGKILDDFKIIKSLETINYLLERNAKIVLMSHLGKPRGKIVEELRLNIIAERLSELLSRKIIKLNDCVGEEVKNKVKVANFGEIILLENVRFHKEEEEGDESFAEELASLGEVFVMDGFGSVHRAHASVSVIAKFLPAVAGFLLEKEVDVLTEVLENPSRPYIAILGGAKISTKLGLIKKFLEQADKVIVAGALANTIFASQGISVGGSKIDKEKLDEIKNLIDNKKLVLPIDSVVGGDNGDSSRTVEIGGEISDREYIYDIGIKSVELFKSYIKNSGLVVWNGPMGKVEDKRFVMGTDELAKILVSAKSAVVGGGETSMVIRKLGLEDKIYHLSTGGGAMLEFLEGKKLPGIECLLNRE